MQQYFQRLMAIVNIRRARDKRTLEVKPQFCLTMHLTGLSICPFVLSNFAETFQRGVDVIF